MTEYVEDPGRVVVRRASDEPRAKVGKELFHPCRNAGRVTPRTLLGRPHLIILAAVTWPHWPGLKPVRDGFDEGILNQANDERPRAGFEVGRASRNLNRGGHLTAAVCAL